MASDLGEEMDTETEISGDIRNLLPREGSVNAYGFHLGEMKANRTKMMARHVVKLVKFKCPVHAKLAAVGRKRHEAKVARADKCKRCAKFFNTLTDCMEQNTHPGLKSYTCQYCKRSFSNSSACKRHERIHTGEKPYTCKHCKKSFSQSSNCKQHERTHTGEKPYVCKYCKKSFGWLSSCRHHERTHTGEKPYTCKHCKKSFSKSSDCKRHKRSHTGEKPFSCKLCKKSFTDSSSCKRHERTHTGEKPYTCKHCKKPFSRLLYCKKHERTHTGEKPFICKHCKKSFSEFSKCKKHEEGHARASFLKQTQLDRYVKSRRDLSESAANVGGKKSCVLSSLTEENSSQVESLTCWICQKEFSSETCVIQHYDEHMRLK